MNGRLLPLILIFLILPVFSFSYQYLSHFPESWKQIVTLGRTNATTCGNVTRWGIWMFGEGFGDGPKCERGNTSITELFSVSTFYGSITVFLDNNFAINGTWEENGQLFSGYLLIEENKRLFWNGSLYETIESRPSQITIQNADVNFFQYSLSNFTNKSWAQNFSLFRGDITEFEGSSFSGCSDLIYFESASPCNFSDTNGTIGILTGCVSINCTLASFTLINFTDNFNGFTHDDYAIIYGEGNIQKTNGRHFFDFSKTYLEISPTFGYTVENDVYPPQINVSGPDFLIDYGNCVNGTYLFSFYDQQNFTYNYTINKTQTNSSEFCSGDVFEIEAYAKDDFNQTTHFKNQIYVFNATYNITRIFLPEQFWTFDIGVNNPIEWFAETLFTFSGNVASDLNFSMNLSNQVVFMYFNNIMGPWSNFQNTSFTNESVFVDVSNTSVNNLTCLKYNSSKGLKSQILLKSPEYDPKIYHSIAYVNESEWTLFSQKGIEVNERWYVLYKGNKTEFAICVELGKEPNYYWCGDGVCLETCKTCSLDCGICPSSSSGETSFVSSSNIISENVSEPKNITEIILQTFDFVTEMNSTIIDVVFDFQRGDILLENNKIIVKSSSFVKLKPNLGLRNNEKTYIGEINLEPGIYEIINLTTTTQKSQIKLGFSLFGLFIMISSFIYFLLVHRHA